MAAEPSHKGPLRWLFGSSKRQTAASPRTSVSPVGHSSGVHMSTVSTTTGPTSSLAKTSQPPSQHRGLLSQLRVVKTPPSAPQPQIKHNDIFKAVRDNDEESVRLLIAKEGKDILDKRYGYAARTPFLLAAEEGHVGVMKVIHERKPDVLKQTDEYGENALHWAAEYGRLAAVNQLLSWDPKLIDARGKRGNTPFIMAAGNGHVDVLEPMYAEGGEKLLTQTNKLGDTALHRAAGCGKSAAVSQLLEWGGGALLDITNNKLISSQQGLTPWFWAANRPEIRKIMRPYKPASGPCWMIM